MKWHEETVFVTGACGFIGSHLVEALVKLGAKIKALSFYDARGSNGWIDDIDPELRGEVEITAGDVRDADQMRALIGENDIVFHLAALIGIPYSYIAPRSYLETNAIGTLNILQAARENDVKRVLVISTSEVYGTAQSVPISESHPLQAQSPYSASKIAAEKLSESFYKSFGVPVVVARPFNTYGPRQSPRAVIPTILMQALSGKQELSLGDTSTTRDFNYVGDTVTGMIKLAECGKAVGKVVNIGTGTEVSINQVVEAVGRILGRTLVTREDDKRLRPQNSEVLRLCADNSFMESLTGWMPHTKLADGLQPTTNWFKEKTDRYQTEKYYI